jgi:hypothetical protein
MSWWMACGFAACLRPPDRLSPSRSGRTPGQRSGRPGYPGRNHPKRSRRTGNHRHHHGQPDAPQIMASKMISARCAGNSADGNHAPPESMRDVVLPDGSPFLQGLGYARDRAASIFQQHLPAAATPTGGASQRHRPSRIHLAAGSFYRFVNLAARRTSCFLAPALASGDSSTPVWPMPICAPAGMCTHRRAGVPSWMR